MKLHAAICLAIILAGLSATALAAESPTTEKIEGANGWINWERQALKAVGHGILPGDAESEAQAALMARAAAIADAYRNLASVANGVRVTGETYVKNFVTKSDEVRLKVEGFIRGAEIVSEKQLPDRSFEVILQAPLAGRNGLISGISSEILPGSQSVPESAGKPTGLIVDARGLGVKPAMSPKVYDEDGKEVYGTVAISPDYAIEVGIAAYPRSMAQALKSPRAGSQPLVVKALRRGPKFATDVVVSNADADRIRDADRAARILARCSVCILLGPVGK